MSFLVAVLFLECSRSKRTNRHLGGKSKNGAILELGKSSRIDWITQLVQDINIFFSDISWLVPVPRMPVTTRITIFLVGDFQAKPSFPTGILGGGTPKRYLFIFFHEAICCPQIRIHFLLAEFLSSRFTRFLKQQVLWVFWINNFCGKSYRFSA